MYNEYEHIKAIRLERAMKEKEWNRAERHNHYALGSADPSKEKRRKGTLFLLLKKIFQRTESTNDESSSNVEIL